MQLPLWRASIEMVSRSLYFHIQANPNGFRRSPAEHFVEQVNLLGIVKRTKAKPGPSLLTQVDSAVDPDLPGR